ncbi:hypothetical protein JL720_17275 [Aureococcus anophagefferens]|nr:hypothetical protein JL720_17275 [Aureococcus anophagefferens]
MNLFARGLGASRPTPRTGGSACGAGSSHARASSPRAQSVAFSYVDALAPAVAALVCFSICVQAAEGTTFAIVPYVAPKSLGAAAGRRRRWRQRVAPLPGGLFMFGSDGAAGYRALGAIIIASSFLSVFIRIDGAPLFSNDDKGPDPAPGATPRPRPVPSRNIPVRTRVYRRRRSAATPLSLSLSLSFPHIY